MGAHTVCTLLRAYITVAMGICDSTPEGKLPPGWLELFDALKLTRKEITQLQKMFRKVDLDGSGSVDTVELLTLLDIERTRFTEQIFALFDSDGSGKVDFREWVISLWNYCTIGEAGLGKQERSTTFPQFSSLTRLCAVLCRHLHV